MSPSFSCPVHDCGHPPNGEAGNRRRGLETGPPADQERTGGARGGGGGGAVRWRVNETYERDSTIRGRAGRVAGIGRAAEGNGATRSPAYWHRAQRAASCSTGQLAE